VATERDKVRKTPKLAQKLGQLQPLFFLYLDCHRFWADLTPFSLKGHALYHLHGGLMMLGWGCLVPLGVAASGCRRRGSRLALDVKAILTPPCIFHSRFSIQDIQGGAT
jgi:hypothetical protein